MPSLRGTTPPRGQQSNGIIDVMGTTDAVTPRGRPPVPPRPPGTGPSFWWRVLSPPLAVLGSLILAGVVFAFLAGAVSLSNDASGAIATSVAGIGLLALGAALLSGLPATQRRLALAWKGSPWKSVGFGLAAGLGALVAAAAIFAIAEAVDPGVQERLDDLRENLGFRGSWQLGLLVLSLVALAPIGEELVFRALLLRGLVRRMRFGLAAVVSGLVFAGAHVDAYQIWPRALFLVAIGIGFAFLYRRRGYGAAVTAHMTVNTAAAIGLAVG